MTICRTGSREQGREHTSKEIDTELRRWAKLSTYNQTTYRAIRRQIPVAEAELVRHYAIHHRIEGRKAKLLARQWIDAAYRSRYMFPELIRAKNQERNVVE